MKTGIIINTNIETSKKKKKKKKNNNNNECIAAATGKLLSVHDAVPRVRG